MWYTGPDPRTEKDISVKKGKNPNKAWNLIAMYQYWFLNFDKNTKVVRLELSLCNFLHIQTKNYSKLKVDFLNHLMLV